MDAASQSAMASKSDKERTRDASPTRKEYGEYRARLRRIVRLDRERKELQTLTNKAPHKVVTYANNGQNADFDPNPTITIRNEKPPYAVIIRTAECGCVKWTATATSTKIKYCKNHYRRPFDDDSHSESASDDSHSESAIDDSHSESASDDSHSESDSDDSHSDSS